MNISMEVHSQLERLILIYYARLFWREMKGILDDFYDDSLKKLPILLIAAEHLVLHVEDLIQFPKGMIVFEVSKKYFFVLMFLSLFFLFLLFIDKKIYLPHRAMLALLLLFLLIDDDIH